MNGCDLRGGAIGLPWSMPCRLILLVAAVAGGCGDTLHDPQELVRARAPAGAVDCGHVGWGSEVAPDDAHACAAAALPAGVAFYALVDQPVADGRLAIGWIGRAGGGGERLTYDVAYSSFGDDETVAWAPCARIVDRGECPELVEDLCLRCE